MSLAKMKIFSIKNLAILTLSLLMTSQAFADNSRLYFEYDLARNSLTTLNTFGTSTSAEADLDGGMIKFGYDFSNYFAIETHLGTSTTNDDLAPTYTVGIDYLGFAGARFNLRYDHLTLYGLAGAGFTRITEKTPATTYETSKIGPAYGVGLDFYGSKTTSISIAYIQYLDETDVNISSFQIGVKFYFDKPKIQKRY